MLPGISAGRDDAEFSTVMVPDCNAASTPEAHAAALDNFFEFFGDVLNTDEVIARLETSKKTAAA
jgi:nicotinamidase-related amidase